MAAGRIKPTHTLKGNTHVWFFCLGSRLRFQWHTGIQKPAYSLGLSTAGGFFQHQLRPESLEVKFLFSQRWNEPVPALDPSSSSPKRVNLVFQFGDDRRHSLPLAYVVFYFFFTAIDCNREHVGRVVRY